MINKRVVWFCVGMAIGVGVSYIAYKSKVAAVEASKQRIARQSVALISELEKTKAELKATKAALETCIGSTLAKEASLEDFYRQLIYADRIDFTVFAADGSPRRMVLDCPGRGKQ
jgi:hypothetical protein